MVLRITEEAILLSDDMWAIAVDSRNAFNEARRQAILDAIYARFPELSIFVETWYLNASPIWMFMLDASVAIIWSSQGVQQGDPMSPFLFCYI